MSLTTDLTGPALLHDATDLTGGLGAQVERLAALFEGPPAVRAVVQEARDLLRAFQALEARNVSLAVADPAFAFTAAQERLGAMRRAFGAIVQLALDVVRGDVEPEHRAELERIVLLARTAPLTTLEDVACLRAARAARPRRSTAVA